MQTAKNGFFQGDVAFRRITKLPDGTKEQPQTDRLIVAHSETGHHHIVDNSAKNVWLYSSPDQLVSYLRVNGKANVIHLRDYDTHETVQLDSEDGCEVIWEIRRQEEMTPVGWKRVED